MHHIVKAIWVDSFNNRLFLSRFNNSIICSLIEILLVVVGLIPRPLNIVLLLIFFMIVRLVTPI